ncbi:lipocalin family protein [Bosea sp. (in: a-proteobacteria)]|jgi:apolipoprotein D and lipocalin family protein|uniref:lipocalin family protein n=1 Tax=Bosea sp. (in: a-proteobacteria) TaxID=1871050 RepID=UPI002DDC9F49|nr:lipocalin family protein [Bosea sp. (in: a-proteobacteria)]HEV2508649.1 lipocalin family protein [Bosea sp. (in: a-proteobacteria)]
MSSIARILFVSTALALTACNPADIQPSGNASVPEPAKPVDLSRYIGRWHEQARYEAGFQKDCEAVTADYAAKPDGSISVVNSCREGAISGRLRTAEATAKVVESSNGTKLKVSFFGPFEGDYWVLDRAPDYSWSIVGEPSGRYLWLLTRSQRVSEREYARLVARAQSLGYRTDLLRRTAQ